MQPDDGCGLERALPLLCAASSLPTHCAQFSAPEGEAHVLNEQPQVPGQPGHQALGAGLPPPLHSDHKGRGHALSLQGARSPRPRQQFGERQHERLLALCEQ